MLHFVSLHDMMAVESAVEYLNLGNWLQFNYSNVLYYFLFFIFIQGSILYYIILYYIILYYIILYYTQSTYT